MPGQTGGLINALDAKRTRVTEALLIVERGATLNVTEISLSDPGEDLPKICAVKARPGSIWTLINRSAIRDIWAGLCGISTGYEVYRVTESAIDSVNHGINLVIEPPRSTAFGLSAHNVLRNGFPVLQVLHSRITNAVFGITVDGKNQALVGLIEDVTFTSDGTSINAINLPRWGLDQIVHNSGVYAGGEFGGESLSDPDGGLSLGASFPNAETCVAAIVAADITAAAGGFGARSFFDENVPTDGSTYAGILGPDTIPTLPPDYGGYGLRRGVVGCTLLRSGKYVIRITPLRIVSCNFVDPTGFKRNV